MAVINRIAGFAGEMTAWRRHLHAHPEIGLDCHETAAFVVERLRAFGVDVIETGVAQSGVVAVIEGRGAGPAIGLRADMDALPMADQSGTDHASTVPGPMPAAMTGIPPCCLARQNISPRRAISRGARCCSFSPPKRGPAAGG